MTPAAQRDAEPGPDAFSLPPLQTKELWLWLRRRTSARQSDFQEARGCLCGPEAPPPSARMLRAAREERSCRRLTVALERCLEDSSSYRDNQHEGLRERLGRGLDPAGVALFSRLLEEHARGCSAHAEPARTEELALVDETSRFFHGLVGAKEAEVRAWARRHSFGPDLARRPGKWGVGPMATLRSISMPGIPSREEEPDELDEHWQDVLGDWARHGDGLPSFAVVPRVAERERLGGGPQRGWQLAFLAFYEGEDHERQRWAAMPGAQRFVVDTRVTDAKSREILAQFFELFGLEPRDLYRDGWHAKLSKDPDPQLLERFCRWVQHGAKEPAPTDGSGGAGGACRSALALLKESGVVA